MKHSTDSIALLEQMIASHDKLAAEHMNKDESMAAIHMSMAAGLRNVLQIMLTDNEHELDEMARFYATNS